MARFDPGFVYGRSSILWGIGGKGDEEGSVYWDHVWVRKWNLRPEFVANSTLTCSVDGAPMLEATDAARLSGAVAEDDATVDDEFGFAA